MGDSMRRSRWLGLSFAGLVLLGLAACSTPTPSGGSGGGTTVSVTRVGTVPWLAVQDGSGAWQTLSGSSFIVTNSAGKYGVAWECTQPSGQPLVEITQTTTATSTTPTTSCQAPGTVTTYSVSGTVSGIPSGGSAFVAVGGPFSTSTGSYTLYGVPSGAQTILAYGENSSATAFYTMVRGSLTVSGNITGENINLSAGDAITAVNNVYLSGLPSGETPALGVLLAPTATSQVTLAANTSTALAYPLVPSTEVVPGDTYVLLGAGLGSNAVQISAVVSQSPTNGASLSLPSALSTGAGVGVSGSTATATWGSVTFPTSGGLGSFVASVTPSSITSPTWSVVATSGWLGSSTSYTFPDFSSTSGWNASWDFPTGQSATATVLAEHANLTLSQSVAFAQTRNLANLPNGTSVEVTEQYVSGTY